MTWLSLVTTVIFLSGFAGIGVLTVLGASLRLHGPGTTRQSSNRRRLAMGASLSAAAVLLPFVTMGGRAAFVCTLGWGALGVLVGAMFASRVPTRLLAMLLFLSAALFASVALPPHMGTVDAVGTFAVAGLALAALTRMATRRLAQQGHLS